MWLDIALCLILLGCIIGGYRGGFIHTFLHMASWLLSIVLSFAWYPMVSGILKEKTGLYDTLLENMKLHTAQNAMNTAGDTLSGIPAVLQEVGNTAVQTLGDSITLSLANLLFSIAAMGVIIFAIKIIFVLLSFLFSKRSNDGLTGFFDGLFGAVFGAAKGILLILVLLALFVPLKEVFNLTFLENGLAQSTLALHLYNTNPLLILAVNFF